MPGQSRATSPSARAQRALELLRAPHPRLLRQHDPSRKALAQTAENRRPLAAKPHRGVRGVVPPGKYRGPRRRWPKATEQAEASRRLFRRRAAGGPCGGVRQGRRGRHGYASARGNRAPSPAGGCSAGTCACSLGLQVVGETVLNQGQTCRTPCVRDARAPDMAQPVNGTGDHRAGQTRRPRGVKTPRFPQRIYRWRLRLWKIEVRRSPSGGRQQPRYGETALQPAYTPVDEPVDNELRLVIDAVEPIAARARLRGEGSHR